MMKKLQFPKNELNFEYSFNGGQAFRWQQINNSWRGVFAHRVWTIVQEGDCILYKAVKSPSTQNHEDDETLLKQYLRLEEPLLDLYKQWAQSDSIFEKASKKFKGVRILRQDPIENIFTFICSSNNTITRIKSMVDKMCKFYGEEIAVVDEVTYYDFPVVEKLADVEVQKVLKEAKFGYRSKFIQQAACKIIEFGGLNWIYQLQKLPYKEAKTELIKLPGIGAKVADCICLMSLNHLEAIPVDTHVFQIAIKYYLPHLKNAKSVTDRIYNEIGDYFRSMYGAYAGWPHCVLFCNELRVFKDQSEVDRKRKKSTRKDSTCKK